MSAWLGPVIFIVSIIFFISQLAASYVGLELYLGAFWTGVVIFVSITFQFMLPITVGAFIGATKVWEWNWAVAVIFTAPGLIFVIPGMIASLFSLIKNKR